MLSGIVSTLRDTLDTVRDLDCWHKRREDKQLSTHSYSDIFAFDNRHVMSHKVNQTATRLAHAPYDRCIRTR